MTLKDPYERPVSYLRISVTDRCNLKCRYCRPIGEGERLNQKDLLTFEEIVEVVRILSRKGVRKVRLTGGEPLVRRDIVKLVKALAQIGGLSDLSLTTNGVLLGRYAQDLKDAGLKRVNVSLDSLRPDRFAAITGYAAFHDVWDGIQKALEVGLSPVKINVVALKGMNEDEIEDFVRLTFELPLHVRFIEFMPVGGNPWDSSMVLSCEDIRKKIEPLGNLRPIPSNPLDGPARRFKFEGAKGEIGFISPLSSHFCKDCNRLRLTPDGKIRACLFSDEEVDLKTRLREKGEEGVVDALREALAKKPYIGVRDGFRFRKCQRGMNSIGG